MKTIDTIYTVGCSFTKMIARLPGKDLVPYHSQWPAVLGQKFNATAVNEGLWGSSNQRSFRRLKSFLERNKNDLDKILILVQMTFPARFEMPNDNQKVEDYANPDDCPEQLKENWIRLNPGWMDASAMSGNTEFQWFVENSHSVLGSVCLPRVKEYKTEFEEGLQKVYGKTIRYTKEAENLDEITYLYAFKGLLNSYKANGYILFGDKRILEIKQLRESVPEILDCGCIRAMAGEYVSLDNYHPDFEGSKVVADKLYEALKYR